MKPALAVDLDDIIFPFMDGLIPFHNDNYGTELTIEDFHTFDFEKVWGGSREEAVEKVVTFFTELEGHPKPMEGAEAAIDKLSDYFTLSIVTSRFDEIGILTTEWVNDHFPGRFKSVHLCNSYLKDGRQTRRKVDVVEELNAVGLIDDSFTHVSEVASTGRKGILFGNYPWNAANVLPAGVVRVATWEEAVTQLLDVN